MNSIIVFDLDGTLLDDDKKLNVATYDYINCFIKLGHRVVINTGRSYRSASKFFRGKIDIDIISNNGNICRSLKNDKLLFINPIGKSEVLRVIDMCNSPNVYPLVHIDMYSELKDIATVKKFCSSRISAYIDAFNDKVLFLDTFENLDANVLSIVFAGEYEDLSILKENISKKFNIFNLHLMKVQTKDIYMLEVLQKDGDKWFGIQRYIDKYNIVNEAVIAVGDDSNDMLMLKNADIGIAMKNATDKVKNIADRISEFDNNSMGAIKEISKMLR